MKIGKWRLLDSLLVLTIAGLLVLFFWPEEKIELGHDRLEPGAQVCQQDFKREGTDANVVTTVVHYLLYLPAEYAESRKWPISVATK